jgi:hypothetical protein
MSAWASDKPCTVSGCNRGLIAFGFCRLHYERWKRHGDPNVVLKHLSKRGEPRRWLQEHVGHLSDECLIWPFARHPDGRAHMKGAKPTRIMCELAHGPAPSMKHEAAHSCGRGHDACVNPRHLRWATCAENAADKVEHGTVVAGYRHPAAKLSDADVLAIRRGRGVTPGSELARRFGVGPSTISKVQVGKSWRNVQ